MSAVTVGTEQRRHDVARVPLLPLHKDGILVALGGIVVVVLALGFRLYQLDTFMHWAWGDEMTYGIEAQRVVHGYYTSLLTFTWDTAPATYAYLLAYAQDLYGATLHTGRMVSVIAGTLCVPLLILMGRELGLSWIAALVAAGLLAVSHWQAYFSRMVLPAVPAALVLLVALYAVMVAFRRDRWWLSLLAGLACGAAPYVFLSNRVLPAILAGWFGYLLVFHRGWVRRSWPRVVIFAATMTLVVLPLALFWLHNPGWFLNPEQRVGVFSNVDAWAAQHPGQSTAAWNIMIHQLGLAAGMFTIYGGPFVPFGGTYAPAMDAVSGWLLFPAIGYALYRWRQPLVAFALIWFLAIWVSGVVLSHDAPQLEHAVGLIGAVFLLEGLLFDAVAAPMSRRLRRHGRLAIATAAILFVAVSGALNADVFFRVWGSQLAGSAGFDWQYYDAASYVARHPTPRGTAIYAPAGYPDEFFRFLAPQAGEFPASVPGVAASLYIVFPGAPVRPAAIAARIPGARQEVVRDVDGDVAFTAVVPSRP